MQSENISGSNELETLKQKCENNFLLFCRVFLNEHFKSKFGDFHRDLASIVHNPGLKNVVIAAPRYHGKSTLFSFAFAIWCICYDKYSPLLLISATLDLSEAWVKNIKAELEENEMIKSVFGLLKGNTWTTTELECANGYRLRARGRGQQVRGWHYGAVVCDDLEDDELVRSDTGMTYFKDWFNRGLYNTIDDKAKLYYIGTMLSPNCFLKELMEKGGDWTPKLFRAYAGDEKEGNEIFPSKWNHAALQSKKRNDPYAFAMEFMNEPVPDADKRFRPEWIEYYDNAPQGLRVFTTIDPSISTKTRADKTAIVTCGLDGNGRIFVLDVYNLVNDPLVMVEEIFRINKFFVPYKVGIETVVFQKMLKIYLEEKARDRGIYLPIEELRPEGRQSKQMRIMSLIPYFSEHRIFIKKGMYSLIQQLREFSPNLLNMKDDVIDALSYQMQLWQRPGYTQGIAKMTDEEFTKAIQDKAMKELFSDQIEMPNRKGYRSGMTVGF